MAGRDCPGRIKRRGRRSGWGEHWDPSAALMPLKRGNLGGLAEGSSKKVLAGTLENAKAKTAHERSPLLGSSGPALPGVVIG